MVRRVKSVCRLCGGEVEQRNMLTKRGYHPDCAPLSIEANIRSIAAGAGPEAERRVVQAIIKAQLELRRVRARRVDDQGRDT
jgi:hypothetical protein